jgi:hypothetical protein
MFAIGKMQRDVAAIVDVGALKLGAPQHRTKNLFGYRASYRRHWRDKTIGGKGCHRVMHAARDSSLQPILPGISRPAQQLELTAEFIEQARKTARRRLIRRLHVFLAAACFYNQIDRAVLQMKPPAV